MSIKENKFFILGSAETLVLSEWLRQGGCLGEGVVRDWLEKAGILEVSEQLIGICFLDAPRFRENCFCVGFDTHYFARS